MTMHDPRHDPGYGLHYSVEPTPGRHTIGSQTYYEIYGLWDKIDEYPKLPQKFPVEERYQGAMSARHFTGPVIAAGL